MAEKDDTIIAPSFPNGRIKKIMKVDKEISKVNSDALFLVSCSTDLFLAFLAERSAATAIDQNRKTVKPEHIRAAVRMHQPTSDFLLDSLPVPAQQKPKESKQKPKEDKDKQPPPRGTQRIDRFFTKGV